MSASQLLLVPTYTATRIIFLLCGRAEVKVCELRSHGAGLDVVLAADPKYMLLAETGSATAEEMASDQEGTMQRREVLFNACHPFCSRPSR